MTSLITWPTRTPLYLPGSCQAHNADLRPHSVLSESGEVMEPLETLLQQAEVSHGHMCAGQILGVRMALLGLKHLGIDDPRGADRKRLVTYIEIDRCATDAIGMVTGCRLGKRTLKFRDWGKMAATFVDLAPKDLTGYRAIRIAARESSKDLARALHPEIDNKNRQQML